MKYLYLLSVVPTSAIMWHTSTGHDGISTFTVFLIIVLVGKQELDSSSPSSSCGIKLLIYVGNLR